ncbi:MAG: DUF4336 domain-containing protein [Cyanobacteria bacterium P01_G01_bin.49]
MLQAFGPSLFLADGPTISFYGLPLQTRMAVARLAVGSAWVWSPVELTEELARQVEIIGPVSHIVSPNKIHHLFLGDWAERWPDARVYLSPGLAAKRPELRYDAELGDEPEPAWAGEIDQVVFRGSFELEEVIFFHRPSRTVIMADLIERNVPSKTNGWQSIVMRLGGVVGDHGTTPLDWRLSCLNHSAAREGRNKILGWNAERLVIAHGTCVETRASAVIEEALAWI